MLTRKINAVSTLIMFIEQHIALLGVGIISAKLQQHPSDMIDNFLFFDSDFEY